MKKMTLFLLSLFVITSLGCGAFNQVVTQDKNIPVLPAEINIQPEPTATSTEAPSNPVEVVPVPGHQSRRELLKIGPNLENVPSGYNPLTGLPVADPSTLKLPAVLISITNFPRSARPQAGLSFAPDVFEMYITEGATRFLVTFYGDFPKAGSSSKGVCEVREEIFQPGENVIGNRVWEDANKNGVQDAWEDGVRGVCVNLLDADTGDQVQSTSTDSSGYYGFNIEAGKNYKVEFAVPFNFTFTQPNIGNEDDDSDADPSSGQTSIVTTDESWDAGLTKLPGPNDSIDTNVTLFSGEVGPVRSARDSYVYISGFFQDSCLVYASADRAVRARLPQCAMQFGNEKDNINSAMLDVTRLQKIAEESKNPGYDFNYSANLFSEEIPSGGELVNSLNVFYSFFNQQRWAYEPLSGSWLRFEDAAEHNPQHGDIPFTPSLDRLTDEQLAFENVMVLFAQHDVLTPTRINIRMDLGQQGFGYLFRDGQKFKIRWSTMSDDYEKSTGLRRPIRFTDEAGNPIALHPGQTWIHIVTPYSTVKEKSPGEWNLRFFAPAGTK